MMQSFVNGEPYVYTRRCTGSKNYGDTMTMEETQSFLVEALYETFCRCGSNIRKVNDKTWKYGSDTRNGIFHRLFSSNLKQQPDLIYRMAGDPNDTWFYVMPSKDDISLLDNEFIEKSVNKHGILPVLIVGYLWCFDTKGQKNICGAKYSIRFEPISLLKDINDPLPQMLSQKQLIERLALCWQKLDARIIEPYLDKNMHYTVDAVFYEMSSRYEFMNYLRGKFKTLQNGSNPIGVRIGRMEGTDEYALLLHQGAYNQTLIVTIEVSNGRITSMLMREFID